MAIDMLRAARPAGRPKIAADLSGCDEDPDIVERRERFFRVCRSLSYVDKVNLANGLGLAFFTVQRWYYGSNMPDERTRGIVLSWYDKGKPLKRLLPCDSLAGY